MIDFCPHCDSVLGVWGTLIEIPVKAGFPASLGYIEWPLTMILFTLVGLGIINGIISI